MGLESGVRVTPDDPHLAGFVTGHVIRRLGVPRVQVCIHPPASRASGEGDAL